MGVKKQTEKNKEHEMKKVIRLLENMRTKVAQMNPSLADKIDDDQNDLCLDLEHHQHQQQNQLLVLYFHHESFLFLSLAK